MPTLWCEKAWLPHGLAQGVRLSHHNGVLTQVEAGQLPGPDDQVILGLALPGFANGHSHAFHRLLRGNTATGSDFWAWRRSMYAAAQWLDPDRYYSVARALYREMVSSGFTAVGEFHYLHHQPDGSPYPDPAAMSEALIAAATDAGIRLTLLETAYFSSGFGQPLSAPQRRFSDTTVAGWKRRAEYLHHRYHGSARITIGAASHSVRAVNPNETAQIAAWAREAAVPFHIHLSEQVAENNDCQRAYDRSPTGVLEDYGVWEGNCTAVHATHLSEDDIVTLGKHHTAICVCPTTEADLADGIGPAVELHQAGAILCLGSDQNVIVDGLEEAHRLESDQRLRRGSRENFSTLTQLDALTVNGQSSLGWNAGRISAGYLADLVVVDPHSIRLSGVIPERIPSHARADDITAVWVNGTQVCTSARSEDTDALRQAAQAIREAS